MCIRDSEWCDGYGYRHGDCERNCHSVLTDNIGARERLYDYADQPQDDCTRLWNVYIGTDQTNDLSNLRHIIVPTDL